MNTRLKQFIAAENITQAQLADTIDVVRASVSHILSGRNKPSYEFISGLMSHYPHLNMEWLMFGKGKMYKQSSQESSAETRPDSGHEEEMETGNLFSEDPVQQPKLPESACTPVEIPVQMPVNQRKLIKITAFYDDGTFQELMA